MEKKPKIKKIKTKEKKITFGSFAFVLLSLVLTIGLFLGLIILQNIFTEEIVYQAVIVAKEDIPANTILTQENAGQYLTMKNMNILDMTSTTLTTADGLIGKKAIVLLSKGECVTEKDFQDISQYTENITDPVKVSIEITDTSNAVGGKLRAGDVINLSILAEITNTVTNETSAVSSTNVDKTATLEWDTETGEGIETDATLSEEVKELPLPAQTENGMSDILRATGENYKTEKQTGAYNITVYQGYDKRNRTKYLFENIYIDEVLDSSGISIASTDTDANAKIIIFEIAREDESILNEALVNAANVRISKVLNAPIKDMQEIASDIINEDVTNETKN